MPQLLSLYIVCEKSAINSTGLLKLTPDILSQSVGKTNFSNHATAEILSLNRDLTFPPILLDHIDQLILVCFWR